MRDFSLDFGRTSVIPPEAVVREGADGSAEDLMARTAAEGREMTVRGAGRSCNTQTLTRGTVLDNLRDDAVPRFTGEEHVVEVPSGITWLALETWLNQHGRANPVLPSYLGLTVGGTLSVGGFGHGSARSGPQIDHVREIELVDGAGNALRCSGHENAELFRYALGGAGQVGFIRKVALRTVPRTAASHVCRVPHSGLSDLVARLPDVARDPRVRGYFGMYDRDSWYSQVALADDAAGAAARADGRASDVAGSEVPVPVRQVPDYALRLHEEVSGHLSPLLDGESHANVWADYVLDESGLPRFTAVLERLMRTAPLAETLVSLYFLVVRRPRPATGFVFAPVWDAPVLYGVGVFASADRADTRAVDGTRRAQRQLLEACAEAGGRPYLYGAHAFDAGLLERFYGAPALRRLGELRAEHALTHFSRRAFGKFRP